MRISPSTTLPLGIAVLASAAAAQVPTPLVIEGQSVPGVGLVTSIGNMSVLNSELWLVEVDTDNPDTDADGVLLDADGIRFREGSPLPAPAGALLDSFDSVVLGAFGIDAYNFFLDGTSGTNDDSGVYLRNMLLIQESAISGAAALTPGTPYLGFFDVKIFAGSPSTPDLLLLASVDDANIASTVDQVLMHLETTGAGTLASETVIAKEGDLLPGQSEPVSTFATGPHSTAYAGPGLEMFFADLEGDSAVDGVIYLGNTLLAQEGSPSPVPGRNWSSLSSPELDVSRAGSYVFSGSLDGDSATNLVIVRDGAVFMQEGDSPADIAPFLLTSFGSGPLSLSEMGDLLWYGDWDDSNLDVDTGLFLNDRLLVQEGVTTVAGSTVDTLRGVQDGYFISDDGLYVVFEAILADGREGAFLIELGIGDNYCAVNPSTEIGQPATMAAFGSTSVSDNDFTLLCDPVNVQPGIFYFGPSQVQVPFGNGFRCVGGATVRLPVVMPTTGVAVQPVDLAAFGVGAGTLNFQYWYRDTGGGPSTFNLSDALSVLFVP